MVVQKKDFINGIIKSYDLFFDDPSGQQGRNFIFEIDVELKGGGITIEMNPRKIPQLLEMLKIDSIQELPGTSIIMEAIEVGGQKPKWIQNFLASYEDKPFPVNDGKYYGSNLYMKCSDEDFVDFLPKPLKKPSLGEKPDFSEDIVWAGHFNKDDFTECKTLLDEFLEKNKNTKNIYEVGDKPPYDSGFYFFNW